MLDVLRKQSEKYVIRTANCNFHRDHSQQYEKEKRSKWRKIGAVVSCIGLTAAATNFFRGKWNDTSNIASELRHGMKFLSVNQVLAANPVIPDADDYNSNNEPPKRSNRERFNFIADVVETASPAVVCIEIKDKRRVDFFTGLTETTSNGSGFILKDDGLILTCAHVITNKPYSTVQVKLQDGRVFVGRVEDVDDKRELATVRIQCKDLPTMKLGESSKLRPGEWVVAMGSPLTLSNTITAGVISSQNRSSAELGLRGKDMDYIQTDAAITFGNSGGPLINLDGEAIGINTMKVTAGISFAIPIDYAKEFLKSLEENKEKEKLSGLFSQKSERPKRRYMGIKMLSLSPEIILELQLKNHEIPNSVKHGVLIHSVKVDSPAQSVGLQSGDILTHINEIPIHSTVDVYNAVDSSQLLKMQVVRENKVFTVQLTPEDSEN